MNTYDCHTCLYANLLEDGLVMCDRRLLIDNKEIYIESDKVGKSCPCHSDKFVEEWRYMRDSKDRDIRNADDACDVCGRLFNELNKDDYQDVIEEVSIKTKDEDGNEVEHMEEYIVRKCRICIDKGRRLFG